MCVCETENRPPVEPEGHREVALAGDVPHNGRSCVESNPGHEPLEGRASQREEQKTRALLKTEHSSKHEKDDSIR